MSFLGSRSIRDARATILGAPYDATSSFRTGCRHGPEAIRWASQSIETYSPILQRDLDDLALTDLGDLELGSGSPDDVVAAIRGRVSQLSTATLPILLGGEHTITLGAVQALQASESKLAVLQLDAHTDLRDEYDGKRTSHATVMRRIAETLGADSLVQLGVRAGTREEFAFAKSRIRFSSAGIAIPTAVWAWLETRPLYVTIDIDALDPSEAPGTGNPEPEGIWGTDLLGLVRRLGDLHVVGLDLVEVSPALDPSGRTAVIAAIILREAILSICGASRAEP